MFNQYRFIEETHKIALESAIRNHTVLTAPLAARLYQNAHRAATEAKAGHDSGFLISRVENPQVVIGTCTDTRTGLFIQLVQIRESKHLMLTLGSRWIVETSDAATGTTNLVYW